MKNYKFQNPTQLKNPTRPPATLPLIGEGKLRHKAKSDFKNKKAPDESDACLPFTNGSKRTGGRLPGLKSGRG